MKGFEVVERVNKFLEIAEYEEVAVCRPDFKGLTSKDVFIVSTVLEESYCKPCRCFFNAQPDDCVALNCPIAITLKSLNA